MEAQVSAKARTAKSFFMTPACQLDCPMSEKTHNLFQK
jgi:hypothetical protein